jgi:hypothetical protein
MIMTNCTNAGKPKPKLRTRSAADAEGGAVNMSNGKNGTGIHGGNGAEGSLDPFEFTGHGGGYCTSTDVVDSKALRGETVSGTMKTEIQNNLVKLNQR